MGSVEVDGGFAFTRGVPASRPGEEGSVKGGRHPLETWPEMGVQETLKRQAKALDGTEYMMHYIQNTVCALW